MFGGMFGMSQLSTSLRKGLVGRVSFREAMIPAICLDLECFLLQICKKINEVALL